MTYALSSALRPREDRELGLIDIGDLQLENRGDEGQCMQVNQASPSRLPRSKNPCLLHTWIILVEQYKPHLLRTFAFSSPHSAARDRMKSSSVSYVEVC